MYLTKEQIDSTAHLTSRQAARKLGVGKTSVNKYRKHYTQYGDLKLPENARVLVIDIESKPIKGYVWGLWKQNIGLSQIVDHGGMMCFAAKWLGSDEIIFSSEFEDGTETMVQKVWDLLDQADLIVTYNGDRYDIKRINNEFLKLGMTPPAPYKSIDLYKTNKVRFDLPSKKLDYIAELTGSGNKLKHQGFDLWVGCMEGDPEAWQTMQEYNEQDVLLTERVYVKLLPWLTNVVHMGMFSGAGAACPYCGAEALEDTGRTTKTHVQEYTLYQCANCEGWSRGNKPIGEKLESRMVR